MGTETEATAPAAISTINISRAAVGTTGQIELRPKDSTKLLSQPFDPFVFFLFQVFTGVL